MKLILFILGLMFFIILALIVLVKALEKEEEKEKRRRQKALFCREAVRTGVCPKVCEKCAYGDKWDF